MNQIMSAFAVLFASRSRLITCAAMLLVPLLGCAEVTAPLPRDGSPLALRFSIASAFGDSGENWELRGDTLFFRRVATLQTVMVDTVRVVPSAQAWRHFWATAELAGVGRWKGRYVAEHIADGLVWGLELSAASANIETGGSNAYPDRLGRKHLIEMTPEFRAFLAVLQEMTGQLL